VITLDRITSKKIVEKLFKHAGIKDQIKEWQELGIVDDKFKVKDIEDKKYEHLPIDTKYFKDLELEILGQFEDLDKSLDGWLIKSENYQALNTILPKFKEKVQTIYIDPPFNLASSDQFLYRTNYKDANWATLLENRLSIAKEWLSKKGSIFVRCDYNGNWIVRPLMDNVFGPDNLRNELIVNRISKKGFANRESFQPIKYPEGNDYLFFYANNENSFFKFVKIESKGGKEKWHSMDVMDVNPQPRPRIILGKEMLAPRGRKWMFSQEKIDEMGKGGLIRLNSKGVPQYKVKNQEFELLDSKWTDIPGYSSTTEFATENSEKLLARVINTGSQKGALILDYFLGSGTTTAVAHKLGRKWIGVEMGEHFYSVILPRMKKVLAYDKSGISKEVKEYQGGGFFKYYELEQYEEALANCKYGESDLFNSPSKTPYQEYVFMKDEKMLEALEIDYKNKKVKVDLTKLYPDIDIAETLSNLTGKWIKAIKDGEVEFTDGSKINTKELDYKLIKPLIWWE
jgi:adenine specific DNA methylase Mod